MSTQAQFAATPRASVATISTANANRDGTGTIVSLFSAGINGSRVERIQIKATGTTTAGMVRLFLYDGTTYHLIQEVSVTAITPGTNTQSFTSSLAFGSATPLFIPVGYSLGAATNNAETFRVVAFGGDL